MAAVETKEKYIAPKPIEPLPGRQYMLPSNPKMKMAGGFKDYEKKKRNKKRNEAIKQSVNSKLDPVIVSSRNSAPINV